MADLTSLKRLEDYYSYEFTDNDDEIVIDGKVFSTEMTLSPEYPDDLCCRVLIDGEYYYFG